MSFPSPIKLPAGTAPVIVDGVPDGYEPFALARLLAAARGRPLLYVAPDGNRLPDLATTLSFAAPKARVITLPAWDCLPYDRVSPSSDAAARRLDALGAITNVSVSKGPAIVLASANAILQRMPSASVLAEQMFDARPGSSLDMNVLVRRLESDGFERVATVREVGEYAVRGGILDLFVPGADEPVRLDFFGDELETVRSFDPATQRTTRQLDRFSMQPVSEVMLTPETVARFRRGYIEAFGAPRRDDALYQSISEGRRFAGMEHWLPLFHDKLETIFDILPDAMVVFDHLAADAMEERQKQVADHFESRNSSARGRLRPVGSIQSAAARAPLHDAGRSGGTLLRPRNDRSNALRSALHRRPAHRSCRREEGPQLCRGTRPAGCQCLRCSGEASGGVAGPQQARRRRRLDGRIARPPDAAFSANTASEARRGSRAWTRRRT